VILHEYLANIREMTRCHHSLPAIAVPHHSRNAVVRRLALIGVATCISGSLLAGCGTASAPENAAAPVPSASSGADSSDSAAASLPGRGPDTPTGTDVTFAGSSGPLHGVWAAPVGKPKGAVLVVHDDQGLTPHLADVVGRFAGAGYATLCVDLLSGQGSAAAGGSPGQVAMALAAVPQGTLLAGMRAGVVELGRRAPGVKVGAVGFGSGAGALWQLLGAGDSVLAAAVPFYGQAPDGVNFSRTHAAVLGVYPGNDAKLGESQDNVDLAMMEANLVHNSTAHPSVDTGFINDAGTHYNAGAATKAWQATLGWFQQHLGAAPGAPHAPAGALKATRSVKPVETMTTPKSATTPHTSTTSGTATTTRASGTP
jgi:carboxymethylenebutenolidase